MEIGRTVQREIDRAPVDRRRRTNSYYNNASINTGASTTYAGAVNGGWDDNYRKLEFSVVTVVIMVGVLPTTPPAGQNGRYHRTQAEGIVTQGTDGPMVVQVTLGRVVVVEGATVVPRVGRTVVEAPTLSRQRVVTMR